jgi:hypothetical protein
MKNIPKYKPEYCGRLIEYCAKGHTWNTFAAELNITRTLFYDWLDIHTEFAEAKEIADVKCEQYWEKKALKGGSKDFNTQVYKLIMINKFGYSMKPKLVDEKRRIVIIMPALEKDEEIERDNLLYSETTKETKPEFRY